MMYWNGHAVSGWGWLGMSLGTLVFWGLLVTAFVLLFRVFRRHEHTPPTAPLVRTTPERLLAERFARGEVDEEEYQRRLTVLRDYGPDASDLPKH
ncbi:hypothetical protein ADK70_19855 [Streptomyces rimosus subsp. pseudoverticillatus]|uniref:SHOCT domain-containing protein n=1 Tax=Streptomyces rimosus TaxID=1927 RepID=UPI0006B29D6C|nr:SHOCT domain-containing protein [Streptomyces rimosus]KOT86934.1 hypothetical protein ADK70_19855 [Streptomyces rimosus subsp. pseudoverticillatus]